MNESGSILGSKTEGAKSDTVPALMLHIFQEKRENKWTVKKIKVKL